MDDCLSYATSRAGAALWSCFKERGLKVMKSRGIRSEGEMKPSLMPRDFFRLRKARRARLS